MLLAPVPFAGSYGVEIGLLPDAPHERGWTRSRRWAWGWREHRNRTLSDLDLMAQEVLETVLARVGPPAGGPDGADPDDGGAELVQFFQVDGRWTPRPRPVAVRDRPAMNSGPFWASEATARPGHGSIGG